MRFLYVFFLCSVSMLCVLCALRCAFFVLSGSSLCFFCIFCVCVCVCLFSSCSVCFHFVPLCFLSFLCFSRAFSVCFLGFLCVIILWYVCEFFVVSQCCLCIFCVFAVCFVCVCFVCVVCVCVLCLLVFSACFVCVCVRPRIVECPKSLFHNWMRTLFTWS